MTDSFEDFATGQVTPLLRYATVVTCDAYLAEDITQDVLVRAQARWARISAVDAPEHYVKRMILNEFLSWRRRRAARVVPLASWEATGIWYAQSFVRFLVIAYRSAYRPAIRPSAPG